jgi:hypothetical protein
VVVSENQGFFRSLLHPPFGSLLTMSAAWGLTISRGGAASAKTWWMRNACAQKGKSCTSSGGDPC